MNKQPSIAEQIAWMESCCDYYHASPCANAILLTLRSLNEPAPNKAALDMCDNCRDGVVAACHCEVKP